MEDLKNRSITCYYQVRGCRFERQTGKAGRMSIVDFENIPEFSGKPYIGCIFQYADRDNDGYITVDDFVSAMEGLGRIYSEDERLHCKQPFWLLLNIPQ